MNNRPGLLVGILLAIFAFALLVAWQTGMGRSNVATGEPGAPVKKFRAEPGTMRENARAIVSDVPSAPSDGPSEGPKASAPVSSEPKKIETWSEPVEPTLTEKVTREVGALVDEAMNARSITEGVQHIRGRLERMDSPEGRSSLYASMGILYAREGDEQEMTEAFEMAARTSLNDAERAEAIYRHTKALLELEKPEAALAAIEAARVGELETSSRALQIRVVEAIAHEQLGDKAKAAALFEDVVIQGQQGTQAGRADLDSVTRQAAMRAVRTYDELGDKAGVIRVRRALAD